MVSDRGWWVVKGSAVQNLAGGWVMQIIRMCTCMYTLRTVVQCAGFILTITVLIHDNMRRDTQWLFVSMTSVTERYGENFFEGKSDTT